MSSITNNYDKKNTNDAVGRALLQYRTGIVDHCGAYDPFGLCHTDECLYCENCIYRITLENGEALSNDTVIEFDKLEKACIGSGRTQEILFYDYVPKIEDLFNYLFDDNSHYTFKSASEEIIAKYYPKNEKVLLKQKNGLNND